MSIFQLCQCGSTSKLEVKSCSKCGRLLEGEKFKVNVPGKDNKRLIQTCKSLEEAREVERFFIQHRCKKEDLDFRPANLNASSNGKRYTLKEAFELYYSYLVGNNKNVQEAITRMKYFVGIENKFLDDVTPLDIQLIVDSLGQRGLSNQTKRHAQSLILRIYNYLDDMDIYKGAAPIKRKHLVKVDNERVRYCSPEEYERLIAVINSWWNRTFALMIHFALVTGRRRGELFKLRWDQIDMDKKILTLKSKASGEGQTKGASFSLPFNEVAYEILREVREIHPKSEIVFPSRTGKERTCYGNSWTAMCRRANLKNFRFHDLRHHFASVLANSEGITIQVIAKLLGHSDKSAGKMAMRYSHLLDKTLRDAVNIFNEERTSTNGESGK